MQKHFIFLMILGLFQGSTYAETTQHPSSEAVAKQDTILKKIIQQDEKIIKPLYLNKEERVGFSRFLSNIYLKAELGGAKLVRKRDKNISAKLKSKTSTMFGFGIGSYFGDNSRIEIDASFISKLKPKGSSAVNQNIFGIIPAILNRSISRNANIQNYMANIYMDFAEFGPIKIFLGGGLGVACIKDKLSFSQNRVIPVLNLTTDKKDLVSSSKKITNFSYAVSPGFSILLSDKINIDIKYSFKDFGKTKSVVVDNSKLPGFRYRAHTVSGGIRIGL